MRWLVRGRLSHATAKGALRALLRRHEILRTSFRKKDGQLAQIVWPECALKLDDIDLTALAPEERAHAQGCRHAGAAAPVRGGARMNVHWRPAGKGPQAARNAVSLAGKTLFITGASRGIGLAIALRAARDGARIAIAAKTATPHPKLPGTVYSAAEEVERAGGKALPLIVDVRDEASVAAAVKRCAETFGGIDICINNASAINLAPTEQIDMRRYDLIQQINTRGTFVTSRACLPPRPPAALPPRGPCGMIGPGMKPQATEPISATGSRLC